MLEYGSASRYLLKDRLRIVQGARWDKGRATLFQPTIVSDVVIATVFGFVAAFAIYWWFSNRAALCASSIWRASASVFWLSARACSRFTSTRAKARNINI